VPQFLEAVIAVAPAEPAGTIRIEARAQRREAPGEKDKNY
jgi:hypothetical protein